LHEQFLKLSNTAHKEVFWFSRAHCVFQAILKEGNKFSRF